MLFIKWLIETCSIWWVIKRSNINCKKVLGFYLSFYNIRLVLRRGGRAAECTGLENQRGLIALREFKSLLLRHIKKKGFSFEKPFFVSSFLKHKKGSWLKSDEPFCSLGVEYSSVLAFLLYKLLCLDIQNGYHCTSLLLIENDSI